MSREPAREQADGNNQRGHKREAERIVGRDALERAAHQSRERDGSEQPDAAGKNFGRGAGGDYSR